MNLILLYALIFVAIPLGFYFLFAYIIVFHLVKYGLEKDVRKRAALVFCIGLLALSITIMQKFFAVNWNRASITQFMEYSDINIFYTNYD
jgi:hypothetical protein